MKAKNLVILGTIALVAIFLFYRYNAAQSAKKQSESWMQAGV